ncbi:MAG: tripartite tricarboxylate transporter TctB family protein [Hydrotalea sp.]|nr:tripartite tricarboxylate transporter TctB family protein [Hydrotalea sp.]
MVGHPQHNQGNGVKPVALVYEVFLGLLDFYKPPKPRAYNKNTKYHTAGSGAASILQVLLAVGGVRLYYSLSDIFYRGVLGRGSGGKKIQRAKPRQQPPQDGGEASYPAMALIGFFMLAAAIIFFALLPYQTQTQPNDKLWLTSPRLMPTVALAIIALAGFLLSLRFFTTAQKKASWRAAKNSFAGLGNCLQYLMVFLFYLLAILYIGFSLASIIFGQVVLWLAGLRGARWVRINFLTMLLLVLAIRGLLEIWFPNPLLLELLPDKLSEHIARFL